MLPQAERSTRSKLLEMLRTQGSCSTSDLAQAMGVTEMAIRRHIQNLERDGLVRSSVVRQSMGRPAYRYSLTEQADDLFPKNYSQLAMDLLGELEELSEGAELIDRLFERRRTKLERKYRERMKSHALSERISVLAEIQNAGGYMTEWHPDRKEPGTYVLSEHNCPISKIAVRYRQACHCEKQLFENLLDAQVERTECLADGDRRCTYVIRTKSL